MRIDTQTLTVLADLTQTLASSFSLLALAIGLGFFIRLATQRASRSTALHIGITVYTQKRLDKLAYDATPCIPAFLLAMALREVYMHATAAAQPLWQAIGADGRSVGLKGSTIRQ